MYVQGARSDSGVVSVPGFLGCTCLFKLGGTVGERHARASLCISRLMWVPDIGRLLYQTLPNSSAPYIYIHIYVYVRGYTETQLVRLV